MKKKIPVLSTDQETEKFIDEVDLTQLDLSGFKTTKFEFKAKNKAISLRLPVELYNAIQSEAKREGIPYQRYIRQAIEREISQHKPNG